MRCCVPFCGNTSDNVSTSQRTGITFHVFPSDISLRAAWLQALSTQEHHLPDPAVVCSQHFTHDDFYETACCVKQIRPNAIPSTVQMCMICLDTDSKLSLMSKHKLEEAYEQITGLSLFQLCRGGNLKQTLCVLCAQRLINFSRFRDLCLRAHSLMTDLLAQDELITLQHKELMNCTTEHLKFNLTQTTLAANHCDLYIDHTDEEEQIAAEESVVGDVATTLVLKNENSFCSLSNADLIEPIHKDDNLIDNSSNNCVSNDNYSNISIKLEKYSLDEDINESLHQNQIQSNAQASCTTVPVHVPETENFIKIESITFECTLCSEEFMLENEYYEHMSEHLKYAGEVAACVASQVCETRAAVSGSSDSLMLQNKTRSRRLNDVPPPAADCAQALVAPLSARLAANNEYKVQATEEAAATPKRELILDTFEPRVVKTHTGAKPYSCEMCNYKTANKGNFVRHTKTHTGEKPFCCEMCEYKCAHKHNLLDHIKTHTGEKPFCCEICNYRCSHKGDLAKHKRSHTGEKPFSCEICNYRCAHRHHLLNHIKTHTGEKPFSCETCNYRSAYKSDLNKHKKSHTGEKPFSCQICNYRCTHKHHLLNHMKTHTGEKPFCCEICNYRYAHKHHYKHHMKTHTGESPYSCEICNYKFADRSKLLRHKMTIHSDIMPQE